MTRTPARWAAGGLLVLTVAALAASAGFGVATGDLMDAFAFVPVLLAFAGVGAVVASRRPGNPIGWLFLAQGLGAALGPGRPDLRQIWGAIRHPAGGPLGGRSGGFLH